MQLNAQMKGERYTREREREREARARKGRARKTVISMITIRVDMKYCVLTI